MKRGAAEEGSRQEPSDEHSSDNRGAKRTRKKQLWTRIKQRSTDKLRRDQTVEKVEELRQLLCPDDTRATQADILDLTLDFLQRFAPALASSVMPDADSSSEPDSDKEPIAPLAVTAATEIQSKEEPEENGDSAEWARIFMEKSDVIVLVANGTGEIMYASSLARRLLNLGTETVASGLFLQDFVYQSERTILQLQLQSCLERGPGHSRTVRTNIGSKDGHMIPMEVRLSAVVSKEGPVVLLEGSPQIPMQLSEYLDFPCMTCVSVHDTAGRIISANNHIYEVMGIRVEDLRGGIIMVIHHREDQARTLRCQRYLASAGRMGIIRRGLLRVTYRAYHARLQHYVWLTSELGTEEGPDGPRVVALTWFDHPFAGLYAAPVGEPHERDMEVSFTAMTQDLQEENMRLKRDLEALKCTPAPFLSSPEGSAHSTPVNRNTEGSDFQIGRTQSAPAWEAPPSSNSLKRTSSSKSRHLDIRNNADRAPPPPAQMSPQGTNHNRVFGPRSPHSAHGHVTRPPPPPPQQHVEYKYARPFSSEGFSEQDVYGPLVADRSIPSDLPPRQVRPRNGYNISEGGHPQRIHDRPLDMPRAYQGNPGNFADNSEMRHDRPGNVAYSPHSYRPAFSSTNLRPQQRSYPEYPERIRVPSKSEPGQYGPFEPARYGPRSYQHTHAPGFEPESGRPMSRVSPRGSGTEPFMYERNRPEIPEPIYVNMNGGSYEPPDMSRWAAKNVMTRAHQKRDGGENINDGGVQNAHGGYYVNDREYMNRFPPGSDPQYEEVGPARPWDDMNTMMGPRGPHMPPPRGSMPYR